MPPPVLCIACSSSLPPRSPAPIFLTPCCSRPICPICLKSNPRLARYDPCLRCLGGVAIVQGSSNGTRRGAVQTGRDVNIDGGMRDADVYAIGDDEDEDDDENENEEAEVDNSRFHDEESVSNTLKSLPDDLSSSAWQEELNLRGSGGIEEDATSRQEDVPPPSPVIPSNYYLQPNDTLHSISLKYKIDPSLICRLNNLSLSTLRSTPHLLHTRAFLTLPASPSVPYLKQNEADDPEREARRKREIAESRFRNVTKESDRDIARAYVALAENHSDADDDLPTKEYGYEQTETKDKPAPLRIGQASGSTPPALEERAVDRYMDDDEWEATERREGRSVFIPKFPLFRGESGKQSTWGVQMWMRWSAGST